MTWLARDHALLCRALVGSPETLGAQQICERVGLSVHHIPMPQTICAVSVENIVAIRSDLDAGEIEHVTLHELGHHLIHGRGGHHFWCDRDWVMLSKIERQAEEFAYFVALPGDELERLLWDDATVETIGALYSRTDAWVIRRIELAWDAGELNDLRRAWVA